MRWTVFYSARSLDNCTTWTVALFASTDTQTADLTRADPAAQRSLPLLFDAGSNLMLFYLFQCFAESGNLSNNFNCYEHNNLWCPPDAACTSGTDSDIAVTQTTKTPLFFCTDDLNTVGEFLVS